MPTTTLQFLHTQNCPQDEAKKILLTNRIQIKLVTAKGVVFYRLALANDIYCKLVKTAKDFDDEEDPVKNIRAITITKADYLGS